MDDPITGGSTATNAEAGDNFATPIDQMKAKIAAEENPTPPVVPMPFDVNTLTKDQVQSLKRLLEVTPDQPDRREKKNPLIRLRKINDKIVIDFKDRVYPIRVRDENDREVERLHIDIKFLNEDNFQPYPYKDFINSSQVSCEAVKVEHTTRRVITGETVSRETGKLVDMVQEFMDTRYTLKLPSGEQVEIEGRVANA